MVSRAGGLHALLMSTSPTIPASASGAIPRSAAARPRRERDQADRAFWYFARQMFRFWPLLLGALVMVLVSSVTLGVGLLGAKPVLSTILGKGSGLPEFALELNEKLRGSLPPFNRIQIPQPWISALSGGAFVALEWILGTLAALTVIGSAANFLHAYLSLTVVNNTVTLLRRRAFQRIVRAPLRTVVRAGPSDIISRLVNDSAQVATGLNMLVSKAVLQLFKGLAGVIAAFWLDARITAGTLLVVPLLFVVIRKLGKKIKKASGRALESQSGLYAAAAESMQALRVVKVHTTELYEGGRFHRINKQMLRQLNRVRTARALASPLTEMLTIFLLCGIVLGVGNAIIRGQVSADSFIGVIGSLAVAGASLKPLTGIINDIQTTAPAALRLRELLDTPIEPGHERGLMRLARHQQTIEFRDVGLTYSGAGAPALQSVSLTVRHGERVAFVGPNGSGKTTLLSLVPRLFDPDTGGVLIDGQDIRHVSVRSLRAQIGVVTQETVLFRATVAENIAYGNPGATRPRIEEAAARARALEFVTRLPQGFDTSVAEQGQSLSGGQRQRLAIARAMMRDPAILILDEATSMIDAESESQIGAALAEFCKGRTCLIVAHRLSTVQNCDRIVVLDAGQVVDIGTHARLLDRCVVYQQLARHQLLR